MTSKSLKVVLLILASAPSAAPFSNVGYGIRSVRTTTLPSSDVPIVKPLTFEQRGFSQQEGSRTSRRRGRIAVAAPVSSSAEASRSAGDEGPSSSALREVTDREAPVGVDLPSWASERQEIRSRQLVSATSKPNPKSDRFRMKKFHHVEFYCGDATATASRFVWGLGMSLVAKSDQSTGNTQHASYVVQSNDLRFVCTAPYSLATASPSTGASTPSDDPTTSPFPGFDPEAAHRFFRRHGLAGKAIGIEVEDAKEAYEQSISNGGIGVQSPARVVDRDGRGGATIAEVHAYGSVVLRLISFGSDEEGGEEQGTGTLGGKVFQGAFLPNFVDIDAKGGTGDEAGAGERNFGLQRADHIVGNVWDMLESVDYISGMTGMHEFAEFCASDIGTVDSGLNSMVLASNSEMVLLPLNEPTFGTAKKSQIQTFLEQNDGPGLQHMALKTNDIFRTMRLIKANSGFGGFEFMEPPGSGYYRDVPARIPSLTKDQILQLEELGLLADKDDEGVLLQVFTKPVGDRPTLFFEIIQRIGCTFEASAEDHEGDRVGLDLSDGDGGEAGGVHVGGDGGSARKEVLQRGGCGGFGLGNFKALFESIEKYESTLAVGTTEKGVER